MPTTLFVMLVKEELFSFWIFRNWFEVMNLISMFLAKTRLATDDDDERNGWHIKDVEPWLRQQFVSLIRLVMSRRSRFKID